MVRSLFEELRARFEPPPEQPKITPNFFARATRFAWRNAVAVILAWGTLAFIGLIAAVLLCKTPSLEPAGLPLSGNAATSIKGLAPLENVQAIHLMVKNPADLHDQQRELVQALKSHDVYRFVFSPGLGDFYDDRDLLYRPLEEVGARVTYALSLKPLFTAIAQAPTAQSMATLVNEIAGSIGQGRDPQGLDALLNEAADSVQALTRDEDKPVDWAKIADLVVEEQGNTATILALPKAGQEAAAADVTTKVLDEFQKSSGAETSFTRPAISAEVQPVPPFNPSRFASALAIGFVFASFVMALAFARLPLVAAILAPPVVLAPLIAALQFWAFGSLWLSHWPLALGAVLIAGQISLHGVMALVTRAHLRRARETSLMLAAQYEGKSLALLSIVSAAPWLGLVLLRSGDAVLCASVAAIAAALGFACSLTLPVAVLRLAPHGIEWRAAQWFVPAHRVLFETGRWQMLSRVLAVLLVVICCAAIMGLPSKKVDLQLDVPVSIEAQNLTDVQTDITRLGSFSRAKSVRWLGTFLPEQGAEKAALLKQLKDQFPHITPTQSAQPEDIKDDLDTLQDSLREIAAAASARPALKDAADAFRRSVAILAATGNDHQLIEVENRLFGGFNRLGERADVLAAVEVPDLAGLPPELQMLFGKGNGPFRLEVTPIDGVSNADLALDLFHAGFDVRHPAAAQESASRGQISAVLWVLAGGAALVLVVVAYAFRDTQSVMVALTIMLAAGIAMVALDRFWGNDWTLSWLLMVLTILSQLAASIYLTPADRGSTARMAMEAFLAPVLMVIVALPLGLLNAGGISSDIAFLAAGLALVAVMVALLHQHRMPQRDFI